MRPCQSKMVWRQLTQIEIKRFLFIWFSPFKSGLVKLIRIRISADDRILTEKTGSEKFFHRFRAHFPPWPRW